MPVDRTQLDADLQTLATNLPTYIAAVNALIAAIQQPDFSAEDATTQQLISDVQAAQGNLPPPPPKPA